MRFDRGAAWWPRRRSAVLDIALAVGFAGIDAVFAFDDQAPDLLPTPVLAVINALVALLLIGRRRFPVGVAATMATLGFVGVGGLAGIVATYTLAAYSRSRTVILSVAGLAALSILVQPGSGDMSDMPVWGRGVFAAAVVLPPLLLGLYMGTRKELLVSLQEKTARLEREQNLLAERARVEERTRIAREMHDVVANRVSVMVVHSGALRAVAAHDPVKAAETAAVIGEMGRQALDELRQVIGVLRLGEATIPEGTPELSDVRELVEQSGKAGLDISLVVEGEERSLPPAVARTKYRLVQEALTNVHKHAGDAVTRVTLRRLRDAVEIAVENDKPAGRPDHRLPGGGNGLVGLRERVTALGGTFEAGPCREGGFAVRARIPLPAGT